MFEVQGSGFRVQGSGFRVQGSGFRVECALSAKADADVAALRANATAQVNPYLSNHFYQLALESQLPHKTVNPLFTITHQTFKLTVSLGS